MDEIKIVKKGMKAQYENILRVFSKYSVKSTFSLKNLCASWFHEICHVVKWKIYSHRENISSNQLFSNFFSKTIALTKFLLKSAKKISWNQLSINFFSKNVDFTEKCWFLRKNRDLVL